jgi:hypothetical protein
MGTVYQKTASKPRVAPTGCPSGCHTAQEVRDDVIERPLAAAPRGTSELSGPPGAALHPTYRDGSHMAREVARCLSGR